MDEYGENLRRRFPPIGEHAVEVPSAGNEVGARVTDMARAMNEAIPDGSNAGEVLGAVGMILLRGLELTHAPDDRVDAFDQYARWHREQLIRNIEEAKAASRANPAS